MQEIAQEIIKIKGWNVIDNQWLNKKFKFKNWQETINFINKISKFAEEINHHPNINFNYGFCEINTNSRC